MANPSGSPQRPGRPEPGAAEAQKTGKSATPSLPLDPASSPPASSPPASSPPASSPPANSQAITIGNTHYSLDTLAAIGHALPATAVPNANELLWAAAAHVGAVVAGDLQMIVGSLALLLKGYGIQPDETTLLVVASRLSAAAVAITAKDPPPPAPSKPETPTL